MIISNLRTFEEALERYKRLLKENPDSTFYKGLVENTKELIEDIKNHKIHGLRLPIDDKLEELPPKGDDIF